MKQMGKPPMASVQATSIQSSNTHSKAKKFRQQKDAQSGGWNDGIAVQESKIPEYRVAEDKFASGYLAGLKRQKRLKGYLNMVYKENVAHQLDQASGTNYSKSKNGRRMDRSSSRGTIFENKGRAGLKYQNQAHKFSSSNIDEVSLPDSTNLGGYRNSPSKHAAMEIEKQASHDPYESHKIAK